MSEPYGQRGRAVTALVLLAALSGCLVWAGATPGDPVASAYPDEHEVTPSPEAYVGDRVVLGGFVVETDPVVIATRASGYGRFTLVDVNDRLLNADRPLERDDRVTAFGTLEDDSTLVVERAVTRESSEESYMYLVSALGGLWVAGRFVRQWRVDRSALAFVPRERSSPEQSSEKRSSADRQQRDDETDADADRRPARAHPGGDRRA